MSNPKHHNDPVREIHVMLDLETLGTKPGCRIVAIGACTFLIDPRNEIPSTAFYITCQSMTQGLMDAIDPLTQAWWDKQSDEARKEVFDNPNSVLLPEALDRFSDFLISLKQEESDVIYIWGKGAGFDEPILSEAFKRYGIKCPWNFRNSLCHRTLEFIGKHFEVPALEFNGVKHRAIDDAVYQANTANHILDALCTWMD